MAHLDAITSKSTHLSKLLLRSSIQPLCVFPPTSNKSPVSGPSQWYLNFRAPRHQNAVSACDLTMMSNNFELVISKNSCLSWLAIRYLHPRQKQHTSALTDSERNPVNFSIVPRNDPRLHSTSFVAMSSLLRLVDGFAAAAAFPCVEGGDKGFCEFHGFRGVEPGNFLLSV